MIVYEVYEDWYDGSSFGLYLKREDAEKRQLRLQRRCQNTQHDCDFGIFKDIKMTLTSDLWYACMNHNWNVDFWRQNNLMLFANSDRIKIKEVKVNGI